jgi:hypothetical protein
LEFEMLLTGATTLFLKSFENVEHWKYDPISTPLSYGIASTCVEEAREE